MWHPGHPHDEGVGTDVNWKERKPARVGATLRASGATETAAGMHQLQLEARSMMQAWWSFQFV